jgi:DNA-directed RNA polymerase specialized sigma24 family protein
MMGNSTTANAQSSSFGGRNTEQCCLTGDEFQVLLASLDGDRNKAAERYEEIRRKLVSYFERRHCDQPDMHADKVMDRAAHKILTGALVPNVEHYCFGIARLIVLEALRERKREQAAFEELKWFRHDTGAGEETETLFNVLEQSMESLPPAERELICSYYQVAGEGRITHRRMLAEQRGLAVNSLRLRVHRIRAKLQKHFFSLRTPTASSGEASGIRCSALFGTGRHNPAPHQSFAAGMPHSRQRKERKELPCSI